MEAIDAQTSKLNIAKLESILGRTWCDQELVKFQEFMEKYSPSGMWSHRLPTTSPIVPLLFQYKHPEFREHQAPLGYWYGDPIHYLRALAGSIFTFEDFWSKLPNPRGVINNIKYKLTDASQFSGFLFELMVAVGYKSKDGYSNYDVVPIFFNPATSPGVPDIILQKDRDQIAIQCKTRSPLSAPVMSFEYFQYLFGRFMRLIQDYGNSYKLSINLKRKLDIEDIDELLEILRSAIKSNLELPKHAINASCDMELSRLTIPLSGLTKHDLNKILGKDNANLFAEIGGVGSKGSAVTKVALCSVSASHQKSAEEWVASIVKEAADEAQGANPLIIAIHLYQYIPWEIYFKNRSNTRKLEQKLYPIFKSHPRIKHINISSNRQEFFSPSNIETTLETQYVEFDNPFFEAK